MKEIEVLLHSVGILPESPFGRLVIHLSERVERLEREVLPQEPPPEFYEE